MNHSKKLIATAAVAGVLAAGTLAYADNLQSYEGALPIQQASELALNIVPGTIIEAELEREDGVLIWEVEVVNGENQTVELMLDAMSGELLGQEIDDDDHHRKLKG